MWISTEDRHAWVAEGWQYLGGGRLGGVGGSGWEHTCIQHALPSDLRFPPRTPLTCPTTLTPPPSPLRLPTVQLAQREGTAPRRERRRNWYGKRVPRGRTTPRTAHRMLPIASNAHPARPVASEGSRWRLNVPSVSRATGSQISASRRSSTAGRAQKGQRPCVRARYLRASECYVDAWGKGGRQSVFPPYLGLPFLHTRAHTHALAPSHARMRSAMSMSVGHVCRCVCEDGLFADNASGVVNCAECPIGAVCMKTNAAVQISLANLPISSGYYRPASRCVGHLTP